MDSTQIVLKRLVDLKKLSLQLKQQTQNKSNVDVNLVKAILQTTKDVSPKKNNQSSTSKLHNQESNNQIPIFKLFNAIKENSPEKQSKRQLKKNINNDNNYNYKPLFPENANFPKRNNSLPSNQFTQDQEEQLINLRQENLILQKQMKQMQQQLQKYRDLNNSRQLINNRSSKDVPYFQLSQNIDSFHTKITITEKDYKKIEYISGNLDLSLQKIIINYKKQFNLIQLNKVQYIENNIILLQFFIEEQEQQIKVFLKFDNKETLHKWDLGIYINYKIISSLQQEQLFLQQLKHKKNVPQHRQKDIQLQQKDILKSFLDKKQQYMHAQKQLKQSMLQKIQQNKKSLENSQISQHKEKDKFQVFEQEKQQNNLFILQDQQEQEDKQKRQKQQAQKRQKQQAQKRQKQQAQIRQKQQRQKKQKQQRQKKQKQQRQEREAKQLQQKKKLQQQQRLQKQRIQKQRIQKIQEQKKREQQKKRQTQLEQQVKLNHITDRLKYGYMLTKYAKSAYNPHEKKFYVSLDGKKLCWQDKNSNGNDVKSLLMSQILSVNLGDIGDGIEKHVGPKKKYQTQIVMVQFYQLINKEKLYKLEVKVPKLLDSLLFIYKSIIKAQNDFYSLLSFRNNNYNINMFEIKHHNLRYRPKIDIDDSFTFNFDEKKTLLTKTAKKFFPNSISGPSYSLKRSKIQLQPLDNQPKQKPIKINTGRATSNYNKNFFQQKSKFPNITGQLFIRNKKSVQISFKTKQNNDTAYFSQKGNCDKIQYFAQSVKGKRSYNEDRYICKQKCVSFRDQIFKSQKTRNQYNLYGVFDGHGGSQCSEFIKNNIFHFLSSSKSIIQEPQIALKQSFGKLEQKFILNCEKRGNLQTSGSCAVVALVFGNKLYISNLGDSRALLLSSKEVVQLTKDHKPQVKEQKMRIIQHGGKLIKQESYRKNSIKIFNQTRIMPGSLNVSRTIGDVQIKLRKYGGSPGIILAQPQITIHDVNPTQHLLLASDGLFQGLTNQNIHQIYLKVKKQHGFSQNNVLSKLIGAQLIRNAQLTSSDNITIILVKLN